MEMLVRTEWPEAVEAEADVDGFRERWAALMLREMIGWDVQSGTSVDEAIRRVQATYFPFVLGDASCA